MSPEPGKAFVGDNFMFKTILVPLDGSKLSEAVLPMARELALNGQARMILFQNIEPLHTQVSAYDAMAAFDVSALERTMRAEATTYLEHRAAHLRERGIEVHVEHGSETSTPAAIIDCAKRNGADLIAMATNGRGGLHLASVPVLLERPDQSKPA
jgi:nucleotide-binding universal stress UspA family protein